MSLARLSVVGVVVLAGLLAAGYQFGDRQIVRAATGPIWVSPEHLDLGRIPVQESLDWEFPIHNSTDSEIRIANLRASCSCTTIEPRSLRLAPKSRGVVRMKIALPLAISGSRPNSEGERAFRILVIPQIAELPDFKGWEFRGLAYKPYRCDPEVLDFGTVIAGRASPEHLVTVQCQTIVASMKAHAEAPLSTIVENENSSEFRLRVRLLPTSVLGKLKGRILLQANGKSSEEHPAMPLEYQGEIVHDIEAFPPTLLFSSSNDSGRDERIELDSRTETDFQITACRFEPETFEVVEAPPASEASRTHSIVVRQLQRGTDGPAPKGTVLLDIKSNRSTSTLTIPIVVVTAAGTK